MEGYFGQTWLSQRQSGFTANRNIPAVPKNGICPSAAAEGRASKQEYETAETRVSSRIVSLLGQNIARQGRTWSL